MRAKNSQCGWTRIRMSAAEGPDDRDKQDGPMPNRLSTFHAAQRAHV